MLKFILLQTAAATGGAAYLNEGAGKYIGLALLVIGAGVAVYLFRKVLKAKADKAIGKAKDRMQ